MGTVETNKFFGSKGLLSQGGTNLEVRDVKIVEQTEYKTLEGHRTPYRSSVKVDIARVDILNHLELFGFEKTKDGYSIADNNTVPVFNLLIAGTLNEKIRKVARVSDIYFNNVSLSGKSLSGIRKEVNFFDS